MHRRKTALNITCVHRSRIYKLNIIHHFHPLFIVSIFHNYVCVKSLAWSDPAFTSRWMGLVWHGWQSADMIHQACGVTMFTIAKVIQGGLPTYFTMFITMISPFIHHPGLFENAGNTGGIWKKHWGPWRSRRHLRSRCGADHADWITQVYCRKSNGLRVPYGTHRTPPFSVFEICYLFDSDDKNVSLY